MGDIAEFFKSDCCVDIVSHHSFTSVHIASAQGGSTIQDCIYDLAWDGVSSLIFTQCAVNGDTIYVVIQQVNYAAVILKGKDSVFGPDILFISLFAPAANYEQKGTILQGFDTMG